MIAFAYRLAAITGKIDYFHRWKTFVLASSISLIILVSIFASFVYAVAEGSDMVNTDLKRVVLLDDNLLTVLRYLSEFSSNVQLHFTEVLCVSFRGSDPDSS